MHDPEAVRTCGLELVEFVAEHGGAAAPIGVDPGEAALGFDLQGRVQDGDDRSDAEPAWSWFPPDQSTAADPMQPSPERQRAWISCVDPR